MARDDHRSDFDHPDDDPVPAVVAGDATAAVQAERDVLARLLRMPREQLLAAAWDERDDDTSLPRAALARTSGTYRHLARLSWFWVLDPALALRGPEPTRMADIAPSLEAFARRAMLDGSMGIVKVAMSNIAEPDLAAFDAERRALTADEMMRMSKQAGAGAARYAYLTTPGAWELGEGVIDVLRTAYDRTPPRLRAMLLVARERESTVGLQVAENLLSYEELAALFGGKAANLAKEISKRKSEIRRYAKWPKAD